MFGGSKDVAFNQEISDLLGPVRVARTTWQTGRTSRCSQDRTRPRRRLPSPSRSRGGSSNTHIWELALAANGSPEQQRAGSAFKQPAAHTLPEVQMRPVSWAHIATSTRLRAPSFLMRLARWALTVLGVMYRSLEISLLVRP